MPPTPNPLYLASQAQQLGRNAGADGAMFNKVALACMITVALGAVLQTIQPIIKDLMKKTGRDLSGDSPNPRYRG